MRGLSTVAAVAILVGLVAASGRAQVGFKATTVLQTTTTAVGQPVEFPLFRNQFTAVLLEVAPGGQSGRHMHPLPVLVYVLEGQFTIEVEGQPPRTYSPGQAFAESVNMWHNGVNRGAVPVKALVVFTSEEGKPTTIRP